MPPPSEREIPRVTREPACLVTINGDDNAVKHTSARLVSDLVFGKQIFLAPGEKLYNRNGWVFTSNTVHSKWAPACARYLTENLGLNPLIFKKKDYSILKVEGKESILGFENIIMGDHPTIDYAEPDLRKQKTAIADLVKKYDLGFLLFECPEFIHGMTAGGVNAFYRSAIEIAQELDVHVIVCQVWDEREDRFIAQSEEEAIENGSTSDIYKAYELIGTTWINRSDSIHVNVNENDMIVGRTYPRDYAEVSFEFALPYENLASIGTILLQKREEN